MPSRTRKTGYYTDYALDPGPLPGFSTVRRDYKKVPETAREKELDDGRQIGNMKNLKKKK